MQFYCRYSHYGDSIFNLRFFYNIREFLKEKNITILYFYDSNYITNRNELERYVDPVTLLLLDFSDSRFSNLIHLWMGDDIDGLSHLTDFIEYFNRYYRRISSFLGLSLPLHTMSFFQPELYLEDLYQGLDPKFKAVDILIINSVPNSHQFSYNKKKFDSFCNRLVCLYPGKKIITTTPVSNMLCTSGLTIQDIGAISIKAKIIIAVLSGPMTACFNSLTIENVRMIFLLCNNYTFTHSKIKLCKELMHIRKRRLGSFFND